MKLKNTLNRWLPLSSAASFIIIIVTHAVVWCMTKLLTADAAATNFAIPADESIPLVPVWVVVYVLTFVFWAMGILMVLRQPEPQQSRMVAGIMLGEIICCIFFIAVPSCVVRPEITGKDAFSLMLAIIYTTDTPTNCFPSMHCMFAYLVFRQSLCSRVSGKMRVFCAVFAVLVFCSTLFVKQHVILDVVGGVLFGELAFILGQKLPLWKIFNKINKKVLQKFS